MSVDLKGYKVFIASPSGLEEERKAFAALISEYNKAEAVHREVIFQAVGWEDTLAGMGRPQSLINDELKECDYFVLLLHDRWGSFPGRNEKKATSGTEEEYLLAKANFHDEGLPMKHLICLFKSVGTNQLADPGEQLQKVLKFKKKLEAEKTLLFSTFSSLDEFTGRLRGHLANWLRADFGSSIEGKKEIDSGKMIEPDLIELSKGSLLPQVDSSDIIQNAWQYAKEGRLTEAEVSFSKALLNNQKEPELLNYSSFLINTGQLDRALLMIDKVLEIGEHEESNGSIATAFSFRGNVLQTRGDLDGSEEMYKKSLEINEKLGRLEGMANDYGNLGNVLRTRGDLDESEEMYKKALEINEKLERLEGMASDYGNLGIVLKTRGDLDGAEEMYKKSLEIEEKLGRQEGMASDYGNLGNVLHNRGDLDGAEEMHKKSLEINEKLGRSEGMANDYGNLGIVLQTRGDLDGAEEMFKKSLDLAEAQGFNQIIETVRPLLDELRK